MTVLLFMLLPILITGLGILVDRLTTGWSCPRPPWGGDADRDLDRVLHDLAAHSRC